MTVTQQMQTLKPAVLSLREVVGFDLHVRESVGVHSTLMMMMMNEFTLTWRKF